ncbi:extracellular solute-binding protein [Cohnella ginsengisoli]|uniref:Extracellular solute-binding protein n=1 Tax=Cohnella ginsengisoli TaxID=425004 RepID=A0A9X4QLU2_9BACL|nr:extracellular solute-binding protein [Cohnella ginsengisoli]MDG0791194.1 extracellular solute-binding protein [Cohnella ginsengisoli]
MSRRKVTRVLAVVSTLALAGSLLAACAGTKEGGKGASGIPTISILVPQFTTEPIKPDNAVVKKIEAYTKSKLELTWVPSVAYDDKLSITISSGSMPKVLTVINNKASYIVNGARSGQFWEVGPYLKDYPNLSKLNKDVLNNISIDGKVYGLYRYRPLTRDGFVIRKDWLNNLGLQPPKSVDDIYNVLKAFTTQDPDQNGKNDTFGLSLEAGLGAFNDILVYNGGLQRVGDRGR